MIRLGSIEIASDDPVTLALIGAGALVILLVFLSLRTAARTARALEPIAGQMTYFSTRVQALSDGQMQITGALAAVSEAQATAQSAMLANMERRLEDVQKSMGETLHGTSNRTARSLGALQERLETIDRAQAKIEKLSGDVLSLQDILSNKQTRGAFGEIQLNDIVSKALPADSYSLQATLSNGKRADCLIHLPNPPGPIVIDSKFPLEAYEALVRADTPQAKTEAERAFRVAIRTHIKAISERYILEGETADGALMFLPSEAVYAELHAHFPEVVRDGFAARVWIVSPTTCMATLNTMRAILKDARMQAQAGEIRKQISALHRDVELVVERVGKLNTHFGQARRDVEGINIAAERAGKRAGQLESFEFEPSAPDTVVPLTTAATPPAE